MLTDSVLKNIFIAVSIFRPGSLILDYTHIVSIIANKAEISISYKQLPPNHISICKLTDQSKCVSIYKSQPIIEKTSHET